MAKVKEIKADAWEKEVLKAEDPVIVDFWHHMCGWCLKLNPIFEQLPEKFGDSVKFVKVNILQSPENQKLAIGLGVLGTPTMKLFCEGRAIGEIVGFRPLERLVQEIEDLLKKRDECLEQSTPLEL
jgi:thioredoxin 1